jgi:hypothetical protein
MTFTVSADGKVGTYEYTDNSGPAPVHGKLMLKRTVKGAPGSNATAGTWQFMHFSDISSNALTGTYKVDGDEVNYSDPTGNSYTAKLGGKAVPYTEGSGMTGTTVAVKQLGKNTMKETYYRDGKVTNWDTMTVSADGKTMKIVNHNLQEGRRMSMVADKQ